MLSLATAAAPVGVWSWNEWDPLEEVIVGRLDGASGESDSPRSRIAADGSSRSTSRTASR